MAAAPWGSAAAATADEAAAVARLGAQLFRFACVNCTGVSPVRAPPAR